jgi:hypothetical protein
VTAGHAPRGRAVPDHDEAARRLRIEIGLDHRVERSSPSDCSPDQGGRAHTAIGQMLMERWNGKAVIRVVIM